MAAGPPKVELHVHLDCCLSFEVAARLRPGLSREAWRRDFVAPPRCADLADYLTRALQGFRLMQTGAALRAVTEDLVDQLAADGVVYGEVRFAPLQHLEGGLSPERVVGTVLEALDAASARTGVETRLLLCTLRHFSEAQGLATARLLEAFRGTRAAGLDLAADEAGFPLAPHAAAFRRAREAGFPCTAHAGEARGADSVRETLAELRPQRLGHGVRSIEDGDLVAELAARRIHLEVCPSCNVQIGVFPSLAGHPVDRLRRAGVSVGLNTDGRTITDITLAEEYRRVAEAFAWTPADLLRCNLDALDAAFVDGGTRDRLRERLVAGWA